MRNLTAIRGHSTYSGCVGATRKIVCYEVDDHAFCTLSALASGAAPVWIDRPATSWALSGTGAIGVPLAPAAITLLENTPKTEGTDLIFPSPRKLVPLSDMAMSKLMKVMGAKGVPHGFRSTFRDFAAEFTNFSREVAERAMAHMLGDKTEAAYMRSDLFVKRTKLMEVWATFCTTKPQADGKVVQMRSAN